MVHWSWILSHLEKAKDTVTYPHGIRMCLCFATLVGTTATCCPMFLGLCKDFWRPNEEFGWGGQPGWCPLVVGWTLWHQDDIQCLKQGALFPQSGNGRECGRVQSMPIPTGWVTLDGVFQQNPKWPCGRSEVDCFYEGLSPKYWGILAHKVNSENPVTYSKLLLAAQKLKDRQKPEIICSKKTTTAGSLNITHSPLTGKSISIKEVEG